MEIIQAAGLNPNLIYGQSNTADQVTAASSPNYQTTPYASGADVWWFWCGDNFSVGDPLMEFYPSSSRCNNH